MKRAAMILALLSGPSMVLAAEKFTEGEKLFALNSSLISIK